MNNHSERVKETSRAADQSKDRGFFADKIEKLKQRDYTCPFCKEVIKGISAFGDHLKGHCT